VTEEDLRKLLALQLAVRDVISEARRLARRLETERKKADTVASHAASLAAVYDRLVTAQGPYPQPRLIGQLENLARMLGQAEQRPGADAIVRFDDLRRELDSVRADAESVLGRETSTEPSPRGKK
jgi:hypothetical protein